MLQNLYLLFFRYARQDTHFLLYIYDQLRADLFVKANGPLLIKEVLNQSKEICLRRYEKERFTETLYLTYLSKMPNRSLTKQQADVYRALFKWRDNAARKYDESVRYIMPDHMLISLAEVMPTDIPQLLSCCNPVPKFVRNDARAIIKIIALARVAVFNEDLIQGKQVSAEEEHEEMLLGGLNTPQNARFSTFQSPVLTTDQLYEEAKWIENAHLSMNHLIYDNQAAAANVAVANEAEKKARRSVQLSSSNSSVMFGGFEPANSDQASLSKLAQINKSFSSVNVLSPKRTPLFVPPEMQKHHQFTPSMDLDESEDDMRTPIKKKTTAIVENMEEDNDDQDEDDNDNQMKITPDEKVPKSLNDIYKLSKKNRKRNKQKKKLKEDSVTDPSPAYEVDLSAAHTEMKTLEEPSTFMQKVGWVVPKSNKHK